MNPSSGLDTVVTRFAPSPTGHLHIGGARSALFCWAFARRAEREAVARGAKPGTGGRFMVRIEDTDQARSSDESARGILEDLAWLGIEWDDGPRLEVKAPTITTSGTFSHTPSPDSRSSPRIIGEHARDVGSYFQARRVPLYNAYLRQLVESGRAYPAFETGAELEAKRKAAAAAKQTYRYDRAAFRDIPTPAARLQRMAESDARSEAYVIRFLMPDEDIVVHDQVLGDVTYSAGEGGVDDFVIRKADGFPTYHFAVVVDDETMGVTHVMRAQEHLNNTPRHVALQKALVNIQTGRPFRTPFYAHMPLIFNMDGTKMSKRDKAKAARKAVKEAMAKDKGITPASLAPRIGIDEKTLADFIAAENDSIDIAAALAAGFGVMLPEIEVWDFRRNGYVPEAIVNFIGLLGWNPGMKLDDGKDLEKFDMNFLAKHFSIDRIGKTSAKFDRVKLLSFNADYLGAMPDEEFARRWGAFLREYEPEAWSILSRDHGPEHSPAVGAARFVHIAAMVKPRAKTLRDGLNAVRFLMIADDAVEYDAKAVEKALAKPVQESSSITGMDLLRDAFMRLEGVGAAQWTAPTMNTVLDQIAQQQGLTKGVGPIAQALRVAITGAGVSPGIGETLAALGRGSTLKRIARCVERHQV